MQCHWESPAGGEAGQRGRVGQRACEVSWRCSRHATPTNGAQQAGRQAGGKPTTAQPTTAHLLLSKVLHLPARGEGHGPARTALVVQAPQLAHKRGVGAVKAQQPVHAHALQHPRLVLLHAKRQVGSIFAHQHFVADHAAAAAGAVDCAAASGRAGGGGARGISSGSVAVQGDARQRQQSCTVGAAYHRLAGRRRRAPAAPACRSCSMRSCTSRRTAPPQLWSWR